MAAPFAFTEDGARRIIAAVTRLEKQFRGVKSDLQRQRVSIERIVPVKLTEALNSGEEAEATMLMFDIATVDPDPAFIDHPEPEPLKIRSDFAGDHSEDDEVLVARIGEMWQVVSIGGTRLIIGRLNGSLTRGGKASMDVFSANPDGGLNTNTGKTIDIVDVGLISAATTIPPTTVVHALADSNSEAIVIISFDCDATT